MLSPRRNDRDPRYRSLFPDWSGPRPLSWFFMENLLEARAASGFPTNGSGPDEEINIYLARLLTDFLGGAVDPRVRPGAGARLLPPDRTACRRARAEWYRANGDHRLLALGLTDHGDTCRHRRAPRDRSAADARRQDMETGRLCYATAANLLEGRSGALRDLAPVMRRLADHFDDYVHVLAALATRRLGLGAVLAEGELAGLVRVPERPASSSADLDRLLDLVNEQRRTSDPALDAPIRTLAARLDIDPAKLGC
jgi:hypothetical protein